MIVVADTSPLNYLIQIESEHLLPLLYRRILVPTGVIQELAHPDAPDKVRAWLSHPPAWFEVCRTAFHPYPDLAFLDLGEREAIQIAHEQHADLLLIDERKGRQEAKRRGLTTTGTLGVLLKAGESSLIDPRQAYQRLLANTTFRTSATLESQFLELVSITVDNNFTTYPAFPAASSRKLPKLVVHCDWSKDEARRWMAKAVLNDGKYTAQAPELVGHLPSLLQRIRGQQSDSSPVLIGFDFPIGLPKAYTNKVGVSDFLTFLTTLEPESEFFNVCTNQEEITLTRPFYPNSPGGKLAKHLSDALDIEFSDLLRACDKSQNNRPEAGVLFWTLGAKQVGKAAIVGWSDILAPALRAKEIKIWPFHGALDTLLQQSSIVVTETYPSQYYSSIFGALNGSKRNQQVRANAAPAILRWAEGKAGHLQLSTKLQSKIEDGFPEGNDDAFDATIGLFGMIDAIQSYNASSEPISPKIRSIEGWILGQPIR